MWMSKRKKKKEGGQAQTTTRAGWHKHQRSAREEKHKDETEKGSGWEGQERRGRKAAGARARARPRPPLAQGETGGRVGGALVGAWKRSARAGQAPLVLEQLTYCWWPAATRGRTPVTWQQTFCQVRPAHPQKPQREALLLWRRRHDAN